MNQKPLERILQSQGFGSRKECRILIESGRITVNGEECDDPRQLFPTENLYFEVDGERWQYREKLYIMLNKPSAYECSRTPQHHSSVFVLLPAPFIQRGIQCVGRLDQDTTGLLLFTDDGPWLHALTSPKRHVEKAYRVTAKYPITPELLEALLKGVQLHDEPEPILALACEQVADHQLDLTIAEGKYHQVKRMVAAAGNRVEGLHRLRMGALNLPGDLAEGEWRELRTQEVDSINKSMLQR